MIVFKNGKVLYIRFDREYGLTFFNDPDVWKPNIKACFYLEGDNLDHVINKFDEVELPVEYMPLLIGYVFSNEEVVVEALQE